MLDLVLGRLPPPLPAPPTAAQLPSIEVPQPSLRRLAGRRGIDARLTANEPGPVLVEVNATALGEELPIAAAHVTFSQPETRTVKLAAPRIMRRFLQRRRRLDAEVVVSQCTAAGYEYIVRSRMVLVVVPVNTAWRISGGGH
jgi:hypothetical protein